MSKRAIANGTTTEPTVMRDERLVEVVKLEYSQHNPASRVSLDRLKRLKESMEEIGQLVPCLVCKFRMVEGHRRLAVARLLGWRRVRCIGVNEEEASHVYWSVNESMKSFTGHDLLSVWLVDSVQVSPRFRTRAKNAQDIVGKQLLRELVNENMSLLQVSMSRKVVGACGDFGLGSYRDGVKHVLRWLIKHHCVREVNHCSAIQNLDAIKRAVERDEPLRLYSI